MPHLTLIINILLIMRGPGSSPHLRPALPEVSILAAPDEGRSTKLTQCGGRVGVLRGDLMCRKTRGGAVGSVEINAGRGLSAVGTSGTRVARVSGTRVARTGASDLKPGVKHEYKQSRHCVLSFSRRRA